MSGPWEDYQQKGPWDDYAAIESPKQVKQPKQEQSFLQNVWGGIQNAGEQMGEAVKQIGADYNQGNYAAADMNFGGIADSSSPDYQQYKQETFDRTKQLRAAPILKTAGGKIGEFTGKAAPAIAASFLPGGQTLAGSVAIGGLSGMLDPVADYENRGKNATVGALGGGVGYGLGKSISSLASRSASKAAADPRIAQLELLKKEGVTPTIGQTMGGTWNTAEEKLMSVPILGGVVKNARDRAATEFEQAAYNRALTPIGQQLPKGSAGREALNFTEQSIRQSYDDVLNKIGAVVPDAQFQSGVARVTAMVDNMQIPEAAKQKFRFTLSSIDGGVKNGAFTSESFKKAESALGKHASTLGRAEDIYDNSLEPAVKQVQAELRDLLKRQAGQYADDLSKTNASWANFKRAQRASTSVAAEGGEFTPAQFQNAVKALDKSKDKAEFARGNAIGQDLGDAGVSILKNKAPNSGTADRLLPWGLLGGAGYANLPLTVGGVLTGSAAYTKPGTKILNGLLGPSAEGSSTLNLLSNDYLRQLYPALGAQAGMAFGR